MSGPLEMLVQGDVYVADQFGAKRNGPTIGDNVGNAIFARTGNGIVYDGACPRSGRSEGNRQVHFFYTSYDPSYHNPAQDSTGIGNHDRGESPAHPYPNRHCGTGRRSTGQTGCRCFIPPHLAERVASSEIVRLRDMFGHQRLREGTTRPDKLIPAGRMKLKKISPNGSTPISRNCRFPGRPIRTERPDR